eukprot:TRINITY_DN31720_c0_g1_i1.p1 TRINITY_DN31720_c0_g1~~TRINITY_DN31720_c0_g1_i1.p1  ORF type:complete len:259 (+),score=60.77 TRINITY_DN31720_c0_g1_i1:45-779(+)
MAMMIHIRYQGELRGVEVGVDDTVGHLKEKIGKIVEADVKMLKVSFDGTELRDDEAGVGEVGVASEDVIDVDIVFGWVQVDNGVLVTNKGMTCAVVHEDVVDYHTVLANVVNTSGCLSWGIKVHCARHCCFGVAEHGTVDPMASTLLWGSWFGWLTTERILSWCNNGSIDQLLTSANHVEYGHRATFSDGDTLFFRLDRDAGTLSMHRNETYVHTVVDIAPHVPLVPFCWMDYKGESVTLVNAP